jgi:APA family basic amino acid/polyamine antiporter
MAVFLLLINYLGIKTGAWTQNVLTILKIAMMLFLTYVALRYASGAVPTAAQGTRTQPWLIALGLGLIPVFYAYGGYQNTINFGGDIRRAAHNIPRAVFFGIVIIIGLYVIINIAYLSVLGIEGVDASKLVAADVARICFGDSASTFVSIVIFLSALGFVNVTFMQIPRAYYAMAEEGGLPSIFGRVNERTQTQEFALLFLGGMVLLSVFLLGTFEKMLNYVMFFDSLNNATVASTLFVLRRNAAPEYDGFRLPFYPLLPGFFVVFLLGIAVGVGLSEPVSILLGVVVLACGYPIFHLMRHVTRMK